MRISEKSAALAEQIVAAIGDADRFDSRALPGYAANRTFGHALWVAIQVILQTRDRLYVPTKGSPYVYHVASPEARERRAAAMLRAARAKVARAPRCLPALQECSNPIILHRVRARIRQFEHPIELVALGHEHARAVLAVEESAADMIARAGRQRGRH